MDFKILGPVSAELDGRQVALDGAKQRTVLAALLLAHGQVITDERLTTLLWGWEPPATSTNQLYTYMSRLRTRLGPGHGPERQGAGYRLESGTATLDWDTFRTLTAEARTDLAATRYAAAESKLATALALCHGPALSGVTEQLATAEGPHLEEARLAATEQHTEAALALGRHTELVPALTAQVARHPVREVLRGQLMTALHRCGRQADALTTYEEGRAVLADELGIDPGPGLRALHQEILTGTLAGAPGAPGVSAGERGTAELRVRDLETPGLEAELTSTTAATAATAAPIPALLPAAPRDFTGRAAATDEILSALRTGQDVAITGAPGTGKSALALWAAEHCRTDFPEGQLYADLRTDDGTPRSPRDVLGWFLRALGAPYDELPAGLDERAQLYRTLLAGRRVLVVLDNAADDAQVRPLLPGGGAGRTLVTGVRPALATLAGTHLLRLGRMTPTEATALLATIAGADRLAPAPQVAAHIAEFCDRLPLALRIAAARLADRPHWPPQRLADRLAPEDRRLTELRIGSLDLTATLRPALTSLAPPLSAAFTTLATARLPRLTATDAAALLDLPPDDAEEILEQLTDARLAEPWADGEVPEYELLPLAALLAREETRVPALSR
ncbi:BTAD domain-containing putative transcriptional regulator [Streptomyces sp. NPDC059009]|uniref:AfsR/SARP family transcriptional regulator n=1 Tax=Streptomyces sp. NPDC059009 TaxID=3346694 RepID=UPI00368B8A55